MKKRSGLFFVLLLSALMVFGVFGLSTYADDGSENAAGLESAQHKFFILNESGNTFKALGLVGDEAWSWDQDTDVNEPYITPDVVTGLLTKDIIKFVEGTDSEYEVPNYEVVANTDPETMEEYKYLVLFPGNKVYEDVVNFKVEKDPDTVLFTLDANDGSGAVRYFTTGKDQDAYLPANEFEREGYEFIGWAKEPDGAVVKKDKDLINPSRDYTLYAVWQHVHAWEIVEATRDSVTIDCGNPGCDLEEPFIFTLKPAEETCVYDGDPHEVFLETPDRYPQDLIFEDRIIYKREGVVVDEPVEAGDYSASVDLTVNDGDNTTVTLRTSYTIYKQFVGTINVKMDSYMVGHKPSKPSVVKDAEPAPQAKKHLFVYTDEDSIEKVTAIITKLEEKSDITIEDFRGIDASLIPPVKKGHYAVFAFGVTKDFFETGYATFTVGPRKGVVDVKIDGWTYGKFDEEFNTPEVIVDGVIPPSVSYEIKPLLDKSAEFAEFNLDEANNLDAGVYALKATVTTNDAENPEKVGYAFFSVEEADPDVTYPVAVENLVANGETQDLVVPGVSKDGNFVYYVNNRSDHKPGVLFYESTPAAKKPGTYYVWYAFLGDKNHNSVAPNKPIKVVIADAEEPVVPDDEDGQVDPAPGDQDGQVDPADTEEEEAVVVPAPRRLKVTSGRRYVKAEWKRTLKLKDVSYVEVTYKAGLKGKVKTVKLGKLKSSYKISGLSRHTTYYVDVHYVKIVDGKKYCSEENTIKIKTK